MKRTSVLLAAIFNLFSAAAAVWETGAYTPGEWEPSVDNLLTADRVKLTSSLARYTKDNPVYAADAGLSDGVMPGAAFDATKVVAIVSGSGAEYLWILARTPELPPGTMEKLLGFLRQHGLPVGELIYSR